MHPAIHGIHPGGLPATLSRLLHLGSLWGQDQRQVLDWQCSQSVPAEKEFQMKWDIVENHWQQFKRALNVRWDRLTEGRHSDIAVRQVLLVCRIKERKPEAEAGNQETASPRLILRSVLVMGARDGWR
jgi:hypothetical protein